MNNVLIEGTKSTPHVSLDAQKREILFRGESYPEDSLSFYQPLIDWIEELFGQPSGGPVTVTIELHYFNSMSNKILMDLFDFLEENAETNKVIINWRYHVENPMGLEYGEEFHEELDAVQFNLVSFGDE
jgi:hypothetical protein